MKRALPPCFLALIGCGSESSDPIISSTLDASDMAFSLRAEGNGAEVLVAATITDGANRAVTLSAEDVLSVSATDASPHPFAASGASGYIAVLPTRETMVVLTLTRPAAEPTVPIHLPQPFTLTVPEGPVSAVNTIPLSWTPSSSDAMALDVWGPCVAPLSRGFASDTGTYELQSGDLTTNGGSCELSVRLERSHVAVPLALGRADSAVIATQVRTAALQVTP